MEYFVDMLDLLKKNIWTVVGVAFGLVCLVASIFIMCFTKPTCEECEVCPNCECQAQLEGVEAREEKSKLVVDVKGAVKRPGVYELDEGSYIIDAIETAGGLAKNASTQNINLSRKVSDEMVIYIFTNEEIKSKETSNEVICEIPKCDCETVTVYECPDVNGKDATTPTDTKSKVSLNKASVEEFSTLDGIGESKAKAIIEYRTTNGNFTNIEDIQKVTGIGSALYEKIKDRLTL